MVEYVYDAWGNHDVYDGAGNRIATDLEHIGNLNPIRYRGYYYDAETDLYYLQTRYYDPATCRFVNADDVTYADAETLQGLNLYAYCGNNPVMRIDPTGHKWSWRKFFSWIGTGLAVVAGLAVGIAATIFTGGMPLLAGVIAGAGFGFAAGISSNIATQVKINGWDNVNFKSAFKAGGIGAAIGAVSGLFGAGFGEIGKGLGGQLGYQLSKLTIGGLNVFKAINETALITIGQISGSVIGVLIGAGLGDNLGSKLFAQNYSMESDYGNTVRDQLFGWLVDITKWLWRLD